MSYVNPEKASKYYKVSTTTLRRWAKEKKISFVVTKDTTPKY